MAPRRTAPRKIPQKINASPKKPAKPRTPTPEPDSEDELQTAVASWTPDDWARLVGLQKRATLLALRDGSRKYVPEEADEDSDAPANSVALAQLTDLLKGTLERNEGNSCLVLGPRASGKSMITDHCIAQFTEEHDPIIVRLSGWLQSNDRLAMKEISAQLSEQTGKSFLSDETEAETEDQPMDGDGGSVLVEPVASHLPTLISIIPTLARPTVIILDAFDLFALHARQALLYCLLDEAQKCQGANGTRGLTIIGLTSRVDTINLLEKRVKSRFSGRVLRTSHLASVDAWIVRTKSLLCAELGDAEDPAARHWNKDWGRHVDAFLSEKETLESMRETFAIAKDYRTWTRMLTTMIVRLNRLAPRPTAALLRIPATLHRTRSRLPSLPRMTYASLCLLIACMHSYTAGFPLITFEMLYDYFRDQVRSSTAAPIQVNGGSIGMSDVKRHVLASSFEALVTAKVFVPAGPISWAVSKEFVKFRCVLVREDVKKAVEKSGQSALKRWLSKG